jgi:glycerophosphoryl diester phosphodiesterase
VLAVAILAPLVGLLLKLFLVTTETGVVTDEAIVTFLLHPTGLIALLVVASVSLAILFAETGQLMVIGFGAIEDRRVTWLGALRYAYGHARALLQFAGAAVIRLLLISVPFLAVVGALYGLFLQEYDINYYLAEKPPVFKGVAIVSGALLVGMGLAILFRIAGWVFALPMVLFQHQSGKVAMKASMELTEGRRGTLLLWLLGWIFGVCLLFAVVSIIVGALSDLLIPRDVSQANRLMLGLGVVLALSTLANLAVSIFTTTLFPLCVVRLYRDVASPGGLRPEIAPRGSLGGASTWAVPGKPVFLIGAMVLAGIGVGGYLLLERLDAGEDAVIIAHRGGAAVAPENTMAAFQRGIADGADWLELDVQEDAEGVVVVGHDRDYMRVGGANLEVWKARMSDLEDLDIGSFFDPRFSEERVPTLKQVLELARGEAGLFIELKYYGHDQNLEAKVVDLVEAAGMATNIVVMSLNYDGVRKAAALRPDWTCGLLNAVAIGDLTHLDVDFLALTTKAASLGTIRRAHQRGLKVYAWTVNDPIQMSVMMSRGVDGIITDQVAMAHRVKQARDKLTPLGRFLVWMAGETGLLNGMEESSTQDDA